MPVESENERRNLAAAKAEFVLGAKPCAMANPLTVLASPAWRGVEGDVWLARLADKSVILKHYHLDTGFYVNPANAIAAAREAGRLGVGPKVLGAWQAEGLVAFEQLGSPWVAGGLHHATDRDLRSKIIEQKKTFQMNAALKNTISIFDEIARFHAITEKEGVATHNDIIPFIEFAKEAEAKIGSLGADVKPCHRDGNTANLMVHPDKDIKLIDFDLAGQCDPFEDVGAFLVEFFENDADARAGFEEWHGSVNEGLFQRSMIYGLLDDLRWGLIGAIMGARSGRTNLEFTKYAAWRFMRLQAQAKRSDANDRIRIAA